MTTAEIVREIARRGHTIALDGETLVVRPRMARALKERVQACKSDILAYLRELDAPAATGHAFAALAAADRERVRTSGVCISCGITWAMHGEPPTASWRYLDNANDVALIDAAAIVAGMAAARVAEDAERAS